MAHINQCPILERPGSYLPVLCSLTNRGGICSNDSRQVIRADRKSVDSTVCTEVLIYQVTCFNVWREAQYRIKLNHASVLRLVQLCCKAWRETQAVKTEFSVVVCVYPLNLHSTHGAVCVPEAAAVTYGYTGRPEDNEVFSQLLDGNSSVCRLHPEVLAQGTWTAVSLHLDTENTLWIKSLHAPFKVAFSLYLSFKGQSMPSYLMICRFNPIYRVLTAVWLRGDEAGCSDL